MFREVLQEVVEQTDGALACLIMDFEGIRLDSYVKPGASIDINTVGAEYSVILKSIQQASRLLDAGDAAEVSVATDRVLTLVRIINPSYFVALAITPEGNLGKGRYALRVKLPTLRRDLG
jgi:predicted regulator of Ras-like GTPase activity (Roadblock/LC7/MglB family)